MALAFVICPAIILGIIIGLIEANFVHADEPGPIGMKHAIHAIPTTIIFVLISMNIGYLLQILNVGVVENSTIDLGVRAVIAVIAMIKIQAAAAIGRGIGEKLPHTAGIGLLIFGAPYIWEMFISKLVTLPC